MDKMPNKAKRKIAMMKIKKLKDYIKNLINLEQKILDINIILQVATYLKGDKYAKSR